MKIGLQCTVVHPLKSPFWVLQEKLSSDDSISTLETQQGIPNFAMGKKEMPSPNHHLLYNIQKHYCKFNLSQSLKRSNRIHKKASMVPNESTQKNILKHQDCFQQSCSHTCVLCRSSHTFSHGKGINSARHSTYWWFTVDQILRQNDLKIWVKMICCTLTSPKRHAGQPPLHNKNSNRYHLFLVYSIGTTIIG